MADTMAGTVACAPYGGILPWLVPGPLAVFCLRIPGIQNIENYAIMHSVYLCSLSRFRVI